MKPISSLHPKSKFMDLGSLNSTYIPYHKVSLKIVEQLKGQMGLNLHISIAKLRGIEKNAESWQDRYAWNLKALFIKNSE